MYQDWHLTVVVQEGPAPVYCQTQRLHKSGGSEWERLRLHIAQRGEVQQ
jgi:hypothetical protein